MLNKRLIYKFTDLFTGISRHNKRDFDTDYNDFVVAQDELSILADRAKSEDSLNMFLAHVDESVTGFCKYACDNHEYLSKAIQNAYLIENKKAQVEGNTSLDKHLIYKSFMSGRLHDLTFKYCVEMKDVAKGFNTLSSKFGMSFDAFHLNDIVDTFNTGLVIDNDFRPNLNVKEASTSKRKVLKQLDSDALSNETSYDV